MDGSQAIGKSRAGRTTKIHAVTEDSRRLVSFLLTPGSSADCAATIPLLSGFKVARQVLADETYDSDQFRDWLKRRGSTPVIPHKANRTAPHPFKPRRYRQRNKIERMFCRLKDARRIATHDDKSAIAYLNAICLISTVYWWP
ncbi:MAG: IS5 family transposase [Deltaproteobacteria bacterium]|nr:IS5 family transposase [Deltaproteobacteria bacterium]